jgi:hypothetical protein
MHKNEQGNALLLLTMTVETSGKKVMFADEYLHRALLSGKLFVKLFSLYTCNNSPFN